MLPVQTSGLKSVLLPQVFQAVLVESIAEAVISTDKDFKILTWNKAAESIYNIPAVEAIGLEAQEVFDYTYINTTREDAFATILEKKQWRGVVKYMRNDGKEIVLDASVTEVLSDTNDLLGYVAVNRDITEMTELRLSFDGLKFTFANIEEGVLLIDKEHKIRYINAKAQKIMRAIFNISLDLHSNLLDYFPPQRKVDITKHLNLAFSGKDSHYESTFDKDNQNFLYVHERYFPIKNEYNEVSYVSVIVKNITKQKRDQLRIEKLSKGKTQFERFMDKSQVVAWIADRHGNMRYMNHMYLKKFGIESNYHGKHIRELFPAKVAEQYLRNNEETLRKGRAVHTIEKGVLPYGVVRTYKVIRFPIDSANETLVCGWAVDITDDIGTIQEKL